MAIHRRDNNYGLTHAAVRSNDGSLQTDILLKLFPQKKMEMAIDVAKIR